MNVLAATVILTGAGLVALLTFELRSQPAPGIDAVLPTRQVSAVGPPAPKQPTETERAAAEQHFAETAFGERLKRGEWIR